MLFGVTEHWGKLFGGVDLRRAGVPCSEGDGTSWDPAHWPTT